MKDEEIKKIAQAYGESEANCYDYDMYSNPDFRHKLKAKNEANKAKAVLEWLSHDYCIVPRKSVAEWVNDIEFFMPDKRSVTMLKIGAKSLFGKELFEEEKK